MEEMKKRKTGRKGDLKRGVELPLKSKESIRTGGETRRMGWMEAKQG
jgi:hypothetical protein